ncbi:hypothetical protein PRIPAC_77627 [Pristionchus pacificus]|uniref:Uncharacterized protein n=1 Tax=Pristionchus pacificus TaxID=54126 RepID=A0A2A6BZ34_PRIPA|nr:hypothetical protein PRIPAC_77627 [Pristionchus pacificus]|eukprot:PDM71031.1 hypothetical protein PRIPAC_44427 [Pristionchus pacificus]
MHIPLRSTCPCAIADQPSTSGHECQSCGVSSAEELTAQEEGQPRWMKGYPRELTLPCIPVEGIDYGRCEVDQRGCYRSRLEYFTCANESSFHVNRTERDDRSMLPKIPVRPDEGMWMTTVPMERGTKVVEFARPATVATSIPYHGETRRNVDCRSNSSVTVPTSIPYSAETRGKVNWNTVPSTVTTSISQVDETRRNVEWISRDHTALAVRERLATVPPAVTVMGRMEGYGSTPPSSQIRYYVNEGTQIDQESSEVDQWSTVSNEASIRYRSRSVISPMTTTVPDNEAISSGIESCALHTNPDLHNYQRTIERSKLPNEIKDQRDQCEMRIRMQIKDQRALTKIRDHSRHVSFSEQVLVRTFTRDPASNLCNANHKELLEIFVNEVSLICIRNDEPRPFRRFSEMKWLMLNANFMRLEHWNAELSMWGELNETESIESFVCDFKANAVIFHLTEKEKPIWFPKYLKPKARSIYTSCEIENDESSFDEVIDVFISQWRKYSNCMSLLDEEDWMEVGRIDPIAMLGRTYMGVFEALDHLSMHERKLAMNKIHQRKQWADQHCNPKKYESDVVHQLMISEDSLNNTVPDKRCDEKSNDFSNDFIAHCPESVSIEETEYRSNRKRKLGYSEEVVPTMRSPDIVGIVKDMCHNRNWNSGYTLQMTETGSVETKEITASDRMDYKLSVVEKVTPTFRSPELIEYMTMHEFVPRRIESQTREWVCVQMVEPKFTSPDIKNYSEYCTHFTWMNFGGLDKKQMRLESTNQSRYRIRTESKMTIKPHGRKFTILSGDTYSVY